MLKEKAIVGVLQAEEEREYENEHTVRLVWILTCVGLGLLLPQGKMYGVTSPLGVSLAAAVDGTGGLLVYIATLVGYLLTGGYQMPLQHIAAVAITGAVRWVFGVLPSVAKKSMFSPCLAAGALLLSGLVVRRPDGVLQALLLLAESLAAGIAAYFFGEVHRRMQRTQQTTPLTSVQQTGIVLLAAGGLMAAAPFNFSGISPARVLAGVAVLLFARGGKSASGTAAGTVLGMAFALCMPEYPFIALSFCFSGLLAGVFARYGRFAIAGMYLIGCMLVCLNCDVGLQVAVFLYESVAACVIFMILPRKTDRLFRKVLVFGQHLPAVEGLRRSMTLRLDVAAGAMRDVAQTVEQVSKKLVRYGAPDLGSMYRSVGDMVCRDCHLKLYCWEANFSQTMDALNRLTPILRERQTVEVQDIGGFLERNCRRREEVAECVRSGYRTYLQRESAWQRLNEIRTVISDQFADMGDVLSELGERFSRDRRMDAETAGRVASLCEDFGMPVEETVCILDGHDRMTVEILAEDVGVCTDGGRWFRELEACCGREFDKPAVLEMNGMIKLTVTERPRFTVETGVAQQICRGEKLSGDVCEQYTDGGQFTCILSDGMGSGGRAAVDAAMASGIAARLLRAGFAPDTVLKMVNTALLAKSGDESLTTLDVMTVDLFTGGVCVHKAGAVTTLLKSGNRVSRMEAPSLPVGILRDTAFAVQRDALRDGDILMMMSDGMLFDGVGWMEEYLREASGNAQSIADGILQAAVVRQKAFERGDDMSVAVFCVRKK